MGRTILIIMAGFAVSFTLLANSMNHRYVDSVDRVVNRFASYSANNASAGGAYMALNRLYQDRTWRTGYNDVRLAGDTITVTIADKTVDSTLADRQIRIISNGTNTNATDLTKVIIYDSNFDDFAIWAKDSVTDAYAKDSSGNPDSTLLIENAPFMPDIDYTGLKAASTSQFHDKFGSFTPASGYPNNSFYYFGLIPNVIHVQGDLTIKGGRTVYGIYVVEGNVTLEGSGRLNGILFLPNATSTVAYGGGSPDEASVTGGIVSYGSIDGNGNHIAVQYNSTYMQAFVKGYAPNTGPMRVLSWE